MGAIAKYDWKALHKQWEKTTGLLLQEFCEAHQLNYTNTSRQFQKIDDANAENDKRLTAKILTSGAPGAARKLVSLYNSEDESIALKASTANLGMVGFSSQSAAQQANVNVQVNVPAMFASQENQDELKSLLQGEQRHNGIIEQS